MNYLRPLLAALVAAAPISGVADEVYFDTVSTKKASRDHGRYVGGFAGAAGNDTATFGGELRDYDLSDEDGWLLGIEFGYSFNIPAPVRPSLELEFMYLNNDLNASGPDTLSLRSDLRAFTLMANAALALDLDDHRGHVNDFWANFKPFVGAGFGGVLVRQNNFVVADELGINDDFDDSDFSWGWQVFGGIEYALSDEFSLYGEYKHLVIDDFANGDISDSAFDIFAVGFKVQY